MSPFTTNTLPLLLLSLLPNYLKSDLKETCLCKEYDKKDMQKVLDQENKWTFMQFSKYSELFIIS